jgi:hypothetical protein
VSVVQPLLSPQSPSVSQQPSIGARPHVAPSQVAGLQTELGQGVHDVPQVATSRSLTHWSPQRWNPALQAKPHWPPSQVGVAWAGAWQQLPPQQLPPSPQAPPSFGV